MAQNNFPPSLEFLIDMGPQQLASGLYALLDETDAPIGSARKMNNVMITDKGGIAPRPGTRVLGTHEVGGSPLDGLTNFIKSNGTTELPIKAANGVLKYFHPTLLDWEQLQIGYTPNNEFGFKSALVNSDNEDYMYFGNRAQSYSRWMGSISTTTAPVSAIDTIMNIGSILKPEIYITGSVNRPGDYTGSFANGSSGVGVRVSSPPVWVNNQWAGATLTVTSGVSNGQTRTVVSGFSDLLTLNSSLTIAGGDTLTITFPANSTTFITDFTQNFAPSQWNNFVIVFTSGTYSGQVRAITATSVTGLTFAALAGIPANGDTYRIQLAQFPSSGTLTVGTTQVNYSGFNTSTSLTIYPTGVIIPTGSAVTVIPEVFPSDPKGNRLELHYTRMIIGNVLSGLSRDSSGTLQGSQSTGSWYYSHGGIGKQANQTDFTFSATRVSGEGGIESVPYGGGDITDIANQEDTFYVFKKNYIEADKFSQDSNDLPLRTQLKTGFGSVGHVVKGRDDIYFVTADNQITSVQRVKLADTLPQSVNIGVIIKRLLDTYDFSETNGGEFKNRLFFACKVSPDDTYNNQILVYNRTTKSFEGIWEIGASGFMVYNDKFHYGESASSNIWEMFIGYNDVITDAHQFPINSQWLTNWMHVSPVAKRKKPSHFETLGLNTFAMEGYILDGTQFTASIYKGFETEASLQFTFGNDDADLQFEQNVNLLDYLGANPLGLEPLGAVSAPDSNGIRHFQFLIYFPPIYSNYISFGIECYGLNQYYEITRLAANTLEQPMRDNANIKSIIN